MKSHVLALAACLACGTVLAHTTAPTSAAAAAQPAVAPPAEKAAAGTRDARGYFTDLELQTQDGRKVRFYSDVLEGHTVLINVIYTTCKDACPMITRALVEVKNRLGPLFGKDVVFVSLTSDPKNDNPAALKKFAVEQGANVAGWTFLTGRKENIDHILKKLGQFSENVEEHSTLLIAGNVPAKRWSKIRPDAPPTAISERLKALAEAPAAAAERPATSQ